MKLSCTQENLSHSLNLVNHITPKSHHLPILNNILLNAQNNQLEIKVTNLEIGITTHVRARVDQEGSFTVHGKLFSDAIGLLPHDKIELDVQGNQLRIHSGHAETKVQGLPSEDFPVLPTISLKTHSFKIKMGLLREAASRVVFATSQDESRPELSGVLWVFKNNILTLAATDSYRLAEKHVELSENIQGSDLQIIVPLRTTQEVLRVFEGIDELTIHYGENQLLCVSESTELISRIIDGKYPDYAQIIPSSPVVHVEIRKDEVIRALKLAGLFTRSGLNHVEIGFDTVGNCVNVVSETNQVGESALAIPAVYKGASMEPITFDWRYLLAGIEATGGDTVTMQLTSPQSPAIIKGSDASYLYLLMPIKK